MVKVDNDECAVLHQLLHISVRVCVELSDLLEIENDVAIGGCLEENFLGIRG